MQTLANSTSNLLIEEPLVSTAKRRLYLGMLKVFNLGLMIAAFAAASALQLHHQGGDMPLSSFFSMRVKLVNLVIFGVILICWHGILSLCGQYQSQRLASRRALVANAIKATTVAALFCGALGIICHLRMITPLFMLLFWICASALVPGTRLLIRSCLEVARLRGHTPRYVLILGTNRRAVEFAQRLDMAPELGYRVLGFVDDAWHERGYEQAKYPICCGFANLAEFLRRNVVDEVANYLPLRSFYEHSSQVAALCEQHGIFMRFDPDIFDLKIARARAEELDGNSHITAHSSLLDGWPTLIKRILDFTMSLVLLVILAPILAAVAILIKLTSAGPVFFRQERIGVNKRRFLMYKFRTMVPNAEKLLPQLEALNEAAGPVFKIKNDPRITPIGRVLRRTSLDELPQLFNVLLGDMSLVGPRPLPLRDYEGFSQDGQRRRFSVRPGITCLWQVNGRSNIGFDQWMKLDLQYLDEWSIWLDMKILAQTIPAVLKGSGAA
jgi:exopolysaccharide biosynthesis polyprenyl glycosylphosphotransferase